MKLGVMRSEKMQNIYINKECVFCNLDNRKIITQTENAFAIRDKYPVTAGHTLIIPKVHESNFFLLTQEIQFELLELLHICQKALDKEFNPDGYNVGININEMAGQTVNHVHIHLIPRYKGDVDRPQGGVRGVIPSKKEY